jgi:hypothetical protein
MREILLGARLGQLFSCGTDAATVRAFLRQHGATRVLLGFEAGAKVQLQGGVRFEDLGLVLVQQGDRSHFELTLPGLPPLALESRAA